VLPDRGAFATLELPYSIVRDRQSRLSLLLLVVGVPLSIAAYVAVLEITRPNRAEPQNVTVTVGPETVVFDWSSDACEPYDIPDLPVRAFRRPEGLVQMIQPHFTNYRFVGDNLANLHHLCQPLMRSDRRADPAVFDDAEWLASPYTLDGRTVYSLVHEEYHGHEHSGRCPSGEYLKCWYNSITLAVSRDGGQTFSDAREPPANLVASIPYRYKPDAGPLGLLEPSNIVAGRGEDHHHYFLLRAERYEAQQWGSCLFRTDDISDPASWRAWDGDGFNVRTVNPYRTRVVDPANHVCKPVSLREIGSMAESITYNTYLKRYLLVGSSTDTPPGGKPIPGVYFSTSEDLIHWSRRQLLMPAQFKHTFQCGDPNPIAYPSILDPSSDSRNFETTGRRAYLYFTRLGYTNCKPTLDRDLIRMPIEFAR
jgi:hypothetical protein